MFTAHFTFQTSLNTLVILKLYLRQNHPEALLKPRLLWTSLGF